MTRTPCGACSRRRSRAKGTGSPAPANFISNPELKLDAVLLDLNMPGASGLSVFKVIQATRPNLPVMMLSGHLSSEARKEFEQLGQREFLHKPYSLDDLGRRLRRMLDADPA
jgi:DNA-binding response OmpR family regulator